MQPWVWVLLIVVLVVVVLAAVVVMRRRRTENLRGRFGPEYDRAVEASDDRRNAEQNLLDRARRRDQLDIRPLPEAARSRYAQQWRGIQERFIDDPAGSVSAAHALLDQVMGERGYPTKDFEEQADLVSVDHPRVVENYRAAYGVYTRQRDGAASTEDLRDALVRYRSLFEELLHPEMAGADGVRDQAVKDRDGVVENRDTMAENRDTMAEDRGTVADRGTSVENRDEVIDRGTSVENRDEVIDRGTSVENRDEVVDVRDETPRHRAGTDEPMTFGEQR
jgi:hypothetical protein